MLKGLASLDVIPLHSPPCDRPTIDNYISITESRKRQISALAAAWQIFPAAPPSSIVLSNFSSAAVTFVPFMKKQPPGPRAKPSKRAAVSARSGEAAKRGENSARLLKSPTRYGNSANARKPPCAGDFPSNPRASPNAPHLSFVPHRLPRAAGGAENVKRGGALL